MRAAGGSGRSLAIMFVRLCFVTTRRAQRKLHTLHTDYQSFNQFLFNVSTYTTVNSNTGAIRVSVKPTCE